MLKYGFLENENLVEFTGSKFSFITFCTFSLQLSSLWPNGFMDNNGIKHAIYRAKDRRRPSYSRHKVSTMCFFFFHEHLRKIFHFSSGTQLRSRGFTRKRRFIVFQLFNQHRSNLPEHLTKLLKRLKHVWTPVMLVCHSKMKANSIIM